ncbi:MAG: biotin transporter BioY [Thermoleophilia bacterium]|jgi:biotin transport system substrate-specific component
MHKLELRDLILVAFFAALTSIGALLSVPLPGDLVPIVLSNMIAILSGAILGKWLGPLSQIIYILIGIIGIPVFAGSVKAGPAALAGPTGGYIIGFVVASFLTGFLVERLVRAPVALRYSLSLAAGAAVIYVLGIPWLAKVAGLNIQLAMVKGVYPFLPGDILKVIVGTMLCMSLMTQLPRIRKIPAGIK